MASTNILNSTSMAVYVGGTASTNKAAYSNDASLTINHEPRDITNKDSGGWRQLLEGLRSWSMSCGMLYFNNPTAWGFTDFFASIVARSRLTVYMLSSVSDDIYYTGTAYATSGNLNSPNAEDNVATDVNFEGTEPLSEGNG